MGQTVSIKHAACLAAQLPQQARTLCAENKANQWPETNYLLAGIDMRLQNLAYIQTNGKGTKPRMIHTPLDDAKAEAAVRNYSQEDVAQALGIPRERR